MVQGGTCYLFDSGKFHQVFNLVVKVPLRRVLWLWQCLQKGHRCGDVLARVELLWELHAGIVYDVAVDSACALTCGACGIHPF